MRFILFISVLVWLAAQSRAVNPVYTSADSLKVVSLLAEAGKQPDSVNKVLYFARQLEGIPYVAGTLEQPEEECLVVNLHGLDCTTFVETVLALTLADKSTNRSFEDFLAALQKVRYRSGVLDGYCSRLHYFSDWIMDNECKGLLKEISGEVSRNTQLSELSFMSEHPDSYPHLKNNPDNRKRIKAVEDALNGRELPYIPKALLETSDEITKIKDGDIIALTTNIKGLDISHVGFAFWLKGELHLLHASLLEKKIMADPQPLKDYLKSKKRLTGIRVLSVLF